MIVDEIIKFKYIMSESKRNKIHSQTKTNKESPQAYILYGWGINLTSVKEFQKNISIFATGESHTIYVTSKGQCYGMGSNRFGQLGISDNSSLHMAPVQILTDLPKIIQVACGAEHTFVLTNKYEVYSFGLNMKGQLGHCNFENVNKAKLVISLLPHGNKNSKSSNKQLMKKPKPTIYNILEKFEIQIKYEQEEYQFDSLLLQTDQFVEDMACGALHTLVLTNKGRVFAAGYQNILKGNEDYSSRAEFAEIKIDKKVKHIHAGLSGSVVIADNSAYIWGRFGKVQFNFPSPVKFSDQMYSKQEQIIVDAKVGDGFIILLNSKGQVFTLGENIQGQLGHHEIFIQTATKVNKLPLIKSIYAGRNYCFVVSVEDNTVFGWGSNQYGQITLGNKTNMIINYPTPVGITLKQNERLALGSYLTLALKKQRIQQKREQTKDKQQKKTEETISLKQYKKLQYEYQLLKNLNLSLIEKMQRPSLNEVGSQTSSKFQVSGISKHRTFNANLEIDWKELIIDKMISQGGYGIIYKAKWRQTIVAVKKFKIQTGDVGVRDFLSQCHAMQAVRHPNIVMFLGACTKAPNYSIILEYCTKGSLWSLLQNPDIPLSWEERRRISIQIARAVLYLHLCTPPILHRDLKSLNILLDQNLRVKIGDFGWTKTLDNYMTSKIGTYQWMAPEVISTQTYNQKSDVFSYGIILWEIASREPPYKNINGEQVSQQVLHNGLRPTIPKKTPEAFAKLIKKCWEKDQQNRPNFKEIIKQLETMKL